MPYTEHVWQSNELVTADKLNNMEEGIAAAKTAEDIVNNLTETTTGKILDATQGKALNDNKLENDFSSLSVASTPYSGNEQIALYSGGENYSTTVNELLSAAGGSGSSQSTLVNYVKNCGTISSLPQTFTDANITADMVVLESVLGTPSAQTGDWTVTTANGSVTISGSISGSTTLMLYFGVGVTTAPSILTNLASTTAANVFDTAARPGVMGILPVANGGTGGSAASTARTNLDVYSKSEVDTAISQSAAKTTGNFQSANSNISNVERASWIKYGKVVVVDLTFTVESTITDNLAILFTGLPETASGNVRFRCPPGYDISRVPATLAVTTDGKIINQYTPGGLGATQYGCSFTYICK